MSGKQITYKQMKYIWLLIVFCSIDISAQSMSVRSYDAGNRDLQRKVQVTDTLRTDSETNSAGMRVRRGNGQRRNMGLPDTNEVKPEVQGLHFKRDSIQRKRERDF